MSHKEEIDKATIAHGMWKKRLLSAIEDGASEFRVEDVQVDNRCDFGKWFYGLPAELRETDKGRNIQKLHASFHTEAAKVLETALKGRKDEAMKALGLQSQFAGLSGQLAMALIQWKQTN